MRGTRGTPNARPLRNPPRWAMLSIWIEVCANQVPAPIAKLMRAKYQTLRRSFFNSGAGMGSSGERRSMSRTPARPKTAPEAPAPVMLPLLPGTPGCTATLRRLPAIPVRI